MIKAITPSEFETIYPRMKEEFPPSEMKPMEAFLSLLQEGKYLCLGLFENNTLLGYAMGIKTKSGLFWLDYLHIFRENQGRGYGKRLLEALLKDYAKSGIILETEATTCLDYDDQRNRRMRFYDRFNIQRIDCPYLFPCVDLTFTDSLDLQFIPSSSVNLVRKEDLQEAIREAVGTIHKALPHAQKAMESYIHCIGDLEVERFTLEDIDMDSQEEIEAVGRLIYLTDPYVYPSFFDKDINNSIACAKSLLKRETLFHHKNIKLGKINGKTAGFLVILEKYPKENHVEMSLAMKESLGHLTPEFNKAMEGYFDTLDYQWEGIQIMSLAVLPEFRRRKVASKMLNSLPRENTYSLACVKDNQAGRDLYRKCGFAYRFEYPGYTGIPCVELVRRGK